MDDAVVGFDLGGVVLSTVVSVLTAELLRSFRSGGTQVGNHMSFELVGTNSYGSVGSDLFSGADSESLMHALSVSGLGNTELVGAGFDIVGAARNPRHPQHGQARHALEQLRMRHAKGVIDRPLNRERRYPLGFVPTTLPASTTALVPAAPQNLFRAERLVIPSDIAFDIGVVDVKVGNQSQLVQSVEVPAAMFSEVAIDTHVHFDTAEVGNQISIQARNKLTSGPVDFTAAMVGSLAK